MKFNKILVFLFLVLCFVVTNVNAVTINVNPVCGQSYQGINKDGDTIYVFFEKDVFGEGNIGCTGTAYITNMTTNDYKKYAYQQMYGETAVLLVNYGYMVQSITDESITWGLVNPTQTFYLSGTLPPDTSVKDALDQFFNGTD